MPSPTFVGNGIMENRRIKDLNESRYLMTTWRTVKGDEIQQDERSTLRHSFYAGQHRQSI
jgi:DNA topoisomerase VI subunit A